MGNSYDFMIEEDYNGDEPCTQQILQLSRIGFSRERLVVFVLLLLRALSQCNRNTGPWKSSAPRCPYLSDDVAPMQGVVYDAVA